MKQNLSDGEADLKAPKTVRTSVCIPRPDYEELERFSRKTTSSVAQIVRDAVHAYLLSRDIPHSDADNNGAHS
ncbi:ribbon-helix-helix domain-containing protein [Rosistilla oblonga]|uniref:Ribbon-helix-helix protein CopG domain-containing protein n=1 Tax=Rosistilla oblonga TaxID=2527990 RepID=A0A518IP93_9BACT|nr:ribbon-helix-helix domain-containing protein [Rosistilla oblonga]QDV54925.1 hypothetical protein Mal33_08910 [Rosistilla oblonga]